MSGDAVLALVRHSMPEIDPSRPAREWSLSAEGCRRADRLADYLAPYSLDLLVSSDERKAVQTAAIVGDRLGLPVVVVPGLHEHDRSGTIGHDREAFEIAMARVFRHPGERVLGIESADEARERFTHALHRVLSRHPGQNLCVVSHGTVLSLFVAGREGKDAYALWRRLGLPSMFVLSLPTLRLVEWTAGVPPAGTSE